MIYLVLVDLIWSISPLTRLIAVIRSWFSFVNKRNVHYIKYGSSLVQPQPADFVTAQF